MGVRTIVDLQEFHSDLRALRGLGLRYVHLRMNPAEIEDGEVAAFLQVVRDPDCQPVFVHCKAGSDRTGVVVAVYRVMEQRWPPEQAALELPRFGFHEVFLPLQHYLKQLDRGKLNSLAATQPPPRVVVVP
jgi:protein tyrosine/serine phosphatase